MLRSYVHAASLMLVATSGIAFAGGTTIAIFDLSDHPDANLAPPAYGLRLDNVIGVGEATFSLDFFSDTTLSVIDNGGILEINISGTVYGGSVSGNAYSGTPEAFSIDMNYILGVQDNFGGWEVEGMSASNSGTITRLSDSSSWDLVAKPNDADTAFLLRPDGHRLDGDDSSWVGRGWLMEDSDSASMAGERDWVFTAIEREVPAPGAMALLAIGGLTCARRRR